MDAGIVTKLLQDQLSMDVIVVSCTHLGTPFANVYRPNRLLGTFSFGTNVRIAI